MTIAKPAAKTLIDLQIGDAVVIRRNLEHPAWKTKVTDESGDTQYVLAPDHAPELIGQGLVTDRRHIGAVPGVGNWPGRTERTLLRVSHGFWYDAATGLQNGSEATYIAID